MACRRKECGDGLEGLPILRTRRYNRRQLSLILGEHDAGNLVSGGREGFGKGRWRGRGSIDQVAWNSDSVTPSRTGGPIFNSVVDAAIFDHYFDPNWSVDEMLDFLRRFGYFR